MARARTPSSNDVLLVQIPLHAAQKLGQSGVVIITRKIKLEIAEAEYIGHFRATVSDQQSVVLISFGGYIS